MGFVKQEDAVPVQFAENRTRYAATNETTMMVVLDFRDGPQQEPEKPHSHPHEQIDYIAAGELLFFLDGTPMKLKAGDMVSIPPNVPHGIQLLSEHVRIVGCFRPIREDFLTGG